MLAPVGHALAVPEDEYGCGLHLLIAERQLDAVDQLLRRLVPPDHHAADVHHIPGARRATRRFQHLLDLGALDGPIRREDPDAAPATDDFLQLHRPSFPPGLEAAARAAVGAVCISGDRQTSPYCDERKPSERAPVPEAPPRGVDV